MRASKSEKKGSYLCRVGTYEVRQRLTFPTKIKGYGGVQVTKGSCEGRIYKGKKLVEGNMKDGFAAIKKAYELVCKEGNAHHVSKKIVHRYKLNCE